METVIFDGEDGTELEFGILEQTRVGGVNYLLVIDPEENDEENGSAAYILKDISKDGDEEGCYVFVEDDTEYDAVYKSSKQCWRILISSKKVMQSAKKWNRNGIWRKNIEKA